MISRTPSQMTEFAQTDPSTLPTQMVLSPWAASTQRRAMDTLFVLLFLPLFLLLLALIALAVALTSGLPVVFRQQRLGRFGRPFAVYKFRTMHRTVAACKSAIAIDSADRVTLLGRLLRPAKLDELPQIFNVLRGDMSLVGPRPKVQEQQLCPLPCRPGLTGPATLVFAREESLFKQIPQCALAEYYEKTVLPTKYRLDAEYLRTATFFSDLRILVDTVLARWGSRSSLAQTSTELSTLLNQELLADDVNIRQARLAPSTELVPESASRG